MSVSKAKKKAPPKKSSKKKKSPASDFRLVGRCWVERDGEIYLGGGRITLLERIEKLGSLNAAARSMHMGYRHAWELIDQVNQVSPKPLVTKAIGGRHGGGSSLTPEGKTAVANFWNILENFESWLNSQDPYLWKKQKGKKNKSNSDKTSDS